MNQQKNIRLVLVDDSEADQLLVEMTLKNIADFEYRIDRFGTISDAIAFLETEQDLIDVCLVDYYLGAYTTFDFIDALNDAQIRPLPLVVMTHLTDSRIDKRLMYAGVHDYWSKEDLDSEKLERCIRYAIHRHSDYMEQWRENHNNRTHLAHVSHELKNPLNAIAGFTRVAERLSKQHKTKEEQERLDNCFASISRNCGYLKQLIDELLNYSELESATFSLNREACDLNVIVNSVVKDFLPVAERDQLILRCECSSGELEVYADKTRINQILNNLVSNAIKYTNRGEVIVRTHVEDIDTRLYAVIEVEDTGIGIDAADFENVFTAYKTVHGDLDKPVDSTGLGMTIAKSLVEKHGGFIRLSSCLGKGSVFKVYLPTRSKV